MTADGAGSSVPYRLSKPVILRILVSIALRQERDVHEDAGRFLAPLRPPPQVRGAVNIPGSGPFLLVINHYSRPGVSSLWSPLLAAWSVGKARPGVAVRWLMTSEWAGEDWLHRLVIGPASRWILRGLAHTYGCVLAPPVLDSVHEPEQGAASVRRFLAAARQAAALGHGMGVAPEGRDSGNGALTTLPPGGGRFLLMLTRIGLPVLPAGVCEDQAGGLVVSFGPAAALVPPSGLRRGEADEWAAGEVMGRVAAQLPPSLHGPYAPRRASR